MQLNTNTNVFVFDPKPECKAVCKIKKRLMTLINYNLNA